MTSRECIQAASKNFSTLFGGDTPLFVCDSAVVQNELTQSGVAAILMGKTGIDADLAANTPLVLLLSSYKNIPSHDTFESQLGDCRVLVVPAASFAGDAATMHYTLSRLADVQFEAAIVENRHLLDMFEDTFSLRIEGGGTSLHLDLPDEVNFTYFKTELDICQREWVSVVQYLEVALVSPPDAVSPRHYLSGVFSCDGVVVAQHRFFPEIVGPKASEAWDFLRSRRRNFPLLVSVDRSRLTSIISSVGEDLLSTLLPLVDSGYEDILAECAFSTGVQSRDGLDWSFNTPVNEAADGVHLAIGTGLRGAHIDFVGLDARLIEADE